MRAAAAWTAVERVLAFPARRPVVALVVLAAVLGVAALGISRLRADPSLEAMFPRGDPAAGALVRVLDRFGAAEELLVLVTVPDQPAVTPEAGNERLLAFARRFDAAVAASPEAAGLTAGVAYRADPEFYTFGEKVIGPAGLYYLDDETFKAAQERLTKEGMRAQIDRNLAMMVQPGAAGGAAKVMMRKDPLRLVEFILGRMAAQQVFKTFDNGPALVSPDGKALLIRVIGRRPPSDLDFSKRLTAAVAAAADGANTDGLQVRYTGAYAIAATSERAIRRDAIESIVGSVLFLLGLFVVAYRNPLRQFHLAFIPVALGAACGFGAFGFLRPALNPMTGVIGGILAGMGIDYTVLYLSQYDRHRAAGAGPREAVAATVRDVALGMFAAWLTSAIGFIATGWSSVQAMRDFALLGTLGLAGAFVAALLVLPALLVLFDRRGGGPIRSRHRFNMEPVLAAIARHRRACVLVSLGVIVVAAAVAATEPGGVLRPESDLTVMHPRPNPAIDAQAELPRRFGSSPGSLLVHLKADSPDGLVRLAHAVDRRLSRPDVRQAGVAGTLSLATLLPDPDVVPRRRAALPPAEVDRIIADFRAVIAEADVNLAEADKYADGLRHILTQPDVPSVETLRAYPGLARSLLPSGAFGAGTASGPTEAITLVLLDRSDNGRAARDAVVLAGRAALADLPGATLTGLPVVSYDAESAVRHDLPRLLAVAGLLTAGYLALHFRNVRDVLLAFLPTVFSLTCLAALARLTGQRLNMVNLIALPLLLGIDVDYGIYLVTLARGGRSGAGGPADGGGSVVGRLASGSYAVVVCATSIVLGFGSLVFTSVPAVRSLGFVVAAGVFGCLLATFSLRVALLMRPHDVDS